MPRPPRGILRRTYSPNQVVALNVARARALRGWTQQEAADAIAPYLGSRLSAASFSAIESSIRGLRVKQFSADELVAFARGFRLPLGWFFTPPPAEQLAGLATADAGYAGIEFRVLLDTVLGTPETLPEWEQALTAYASESAAQEQVEEAEVAGKSPERLKQIFRLRARTLLRETFGDLDQASAVLRRLAAVLEEVDEVVATGDDSAPTDTDDDRVADTRIGTGD
ncbi:MAG: helix-turn-helix domain-containing protein [Acidimicrobiales bacterium]